MPSTLVSAALAAAVALAVPPPASATTAPALSCTYTLTRWGGGFTAELSIANSGPAITGWTAHWTFGTPTRITSSWQAALTQTTPNDTVAVPMPWLATIPSGGAVSFGWTAIAAATEVPDDIAINGQRC